MRELIIGVCNATNYSTDSQKLFLILEKDMAKKYISFLSFQDSLIVKSTLNAINDFLALG